MSMSLRQWRRISVDDVQYRWKAEIKPKTVGSEFYDFIIAIRAVEHPNSKCGFISDEVGYFWFGTNAHSLVVRPKLVAACIRYAVAHGWKPAESKQDFPIRLTAELLAQLNGSK